MEQAFVIRPATRKDLHWLLETVVPNLGAGFTSLPNNKQFLENRLHIVEQSFNEKIPVNERVYLFVRENLPERKPVGICGIDLNVGGRDTFYNYQISTVMQSCKELNIYVTHTILNMVNNFQDATEMISFWIDPDCRGKHVAKSLSECRFLFMTQFAEWMGKDIIAEIRGHFDINEISPFWEAVGRPFFNMDFKRADELTLIDKQFIDDLASREPIYLDLLPLAAQKLVGVEHADSSAARRLLELQGFRFSNHIDIFDAGPLLHADLNNIHAVIKNKIATVAKIGAVNSTEDALLYNTRLDVRFTVAPLEILSADEVMITPEIARILELKVGDSIRYYFM